MVNTKDHAGKRYGKIVGVRPTDERRYEQVVWVWECDCGVVFTQVAGNFVRRGYGSCPECTTLSRKVTAISAHKTHGMSGTKEYVAWAKIKNRCTNKNDKNYIDYGGCGIKMCDEWLESFEMFHAHIGPSPKDGENYSVDRIDNTGNYEPGNVRWATAAQQARNQGKQKNNTSGVTGVIPRYTDGVLQYWIAHWRTPDGKLRQKLFSVKNFGERVAFEMACERRALEMSILNSILGAEGYSKNYGE